MYPDPDPVDSALNVLKSSRFSSNPYNPQLEEKLMQEFDARNSPRSFGAVRPWVAVVGIMLVGGAAFAATGGVQMIRDLFVTVQIGDQTVDLKLEPTGEGTAEGLYRTTLPDGKEAVLQVVRSDNPAGDEHQMQVNVNVSGPGTEEESQVEIVHQRTAPAGDGKFTVADLGNTEPLNTWADSAGNTRGLYVVPAEENRLRIFLATTDAAGQTSVRMLAEPKLRVNLAETPARSEVDADGTITLRFGSENDENVLKFRVAAAGAERPTQVTSPDGQIKIELPAADDE